MAAAAPPMQPTGAPTAASAMYGTVPSFGPDNRATFDPRDLRRYEEPHNVEFKAAWGSSDEEVI